MGTHVSADRLDIELCPEREVVMILLRGVLDGDNHHHLRHEVDDLLEVGFLELRIDLQEVTDLDAAGVRLLLDLCDEASHQDWVLRLDRATGALLRTLKATGAYPRTPLGDPDLGGTPRSQPSG